MQELLRCLLYELEGNRLTVCKVPSRGGYKRVVCSTNAEWYQRLCAAHVRPRRRYPKPRTIIKRRETVAALRRMINRGDTQSEYAQRILYVINDLARSGKNYGGS